MIVIASYTSSSEAKQISELYDLDIPIVSDLDGYWLKELNVALTPWKMLVAVPKGRIMYEDAPSYHPAQRSAFIERLEQYL